MACVKQGGFSEIWLADHLPSGEQRVVKVVYLRKPGLRPEDVSSQNDRPAQPFQSGSQMPSALAHWSPDRLLLRHVTVLMALQPVRSVQALWSRVCVLVQPLWVGHPQGSSLHVCTTWECCPFPPADKLSPYS